MAQRIAVLLLLAVAATGCSSRRYKLRASERGEWFIEARRSALDSNELSDTTRNILRRRELQTLAKTDVHATVLALIKEMRETRDRDLAIVIAELAFREAERWTTPNRTILGTTLRYSYAFLFDPKLEPAPDPFDIRFRWACDMYNRTLARFVRISDSGREPGDTELNWAGGSTTIGPGEIQLDVPLSELITIAVAYDYEIEGLPPPQRFEGLGAPCVLIHDATRKRETAAGDRFLDNKIAIAATFVVRFPDDASVLDEEQARGVYNVYDPTVTDRIEIAGQQVPLEIDFTTPVVYSLAKAKNQSPGISALFNSDRWAKEGGLYSLQPTRRGRIPIVLVHGLASDPFTWMPLYNDLMANEIIRKRFRFLVWFYPTGQPASYSAYQLREALLGVHGAAERTEDDEHLDWAVVFGHSMGGLLTHLLVIDPGNTLENEAFNRPIADMDLPQKDKDLLSDVMLFESLPFVRRVIFYATPHGGAPNANKGIFEWLARFIQLPARLMDPQRKLLRYVRHGDTLDAITSIQSLKPDGPLMETFLKVPINKRVTYHSIIGDHEAAGRKGGTDGFVPYESSHIAGAASELILRSGHSVQHRPLAARETRRILLEHLKQFDAASR